jgi:phenylacetate-CoA ligase
VAATLRGGYLRLWRYGGGSERLCEEALERDGWPADRWRSWQEERLASVLHRAATRVPYYREMWSARRRRGDRRSWEHLEHWPILDKEPLRATPRAFVADDRRLSSLFREHTSGTTGTSLDLRVSRGTLRSWYALHEARTRRWNGTTHTDRWAIIGGQLVTPVEQERPPYWVWNAALRQLYMSAYHISPRSARDYAAALWTHRARYVVAYPSALYALARELLAQGEQAPVLSVALLNAEPVYPHQRETIERAFRCPVRETYGMSEMVAAASECEHGSLHLWPEAGWLEVMERGERVHAGECGDFVCTSLLNLDMPLVRYRVGDRGAVSAATSTCACGRELPVLERVEGRSDDVLYTPDGRSVGRLDPVFKAGLPVREAQIVQERLDRVRVRVVPADGYRPRHGESIVDRVRARMGLVTVLVEEVEAIPRTANGKFRAVISELTTEERAWLARR